MSNYLFLEPHPTGGTSCVALTAEQAIAHQRETARQSRGYEYADDEAALQDFVALHWASRIDGLSQPSGKVTVTPAEVATWAESAAESAPDFLREAARTTINQLRAALARGDADTAQRLAEWLCRELGAEISQ